MDGNTFNKILKEFVENEEGFQSYTHKMKNLLSDLIKSNNLKVHSINSRVKSRESLKKKIIKNNKYDSLYDITDICGLRIITYFEDEVKLISELIKKEFCVDLEKTVDKSTKLDPDRFGYLSFHYIVNFSKARLSLPEYEFNFKFEIQIRSILQHAWAEIEHDLGYKNKNEVPHHIRRKFSRIAGLLEIADQEFVSIKKELSKYEEEVPRLIKENKSQVLIDKISLQNFIENNETIKGIENEISKSEFIKIQGHINIDTLLDLTEFLSIQNISELKKLLVDYSRFIIEFTKLWIKDQNVLKKGISIFILGYILIGEKQNSNIMDRYCQALGLSNFRNELFSRVIEILKKINFFKDKSA